MDNPRLVNAAKKHAFLKKIAEFAGKSSQATDREVFFLETLGVALAREATTATGDILAFSEADDPATEVPFLSEAEEVSENAGGGFEGFFFVTSS